MKFDPEHFKYIAERYSKRFADFLQNVTLFNDHAFRHAITKNPSLAEALICGLTERKMKIRQLTTQAYLKGYWGKGVIFDAYAEVEDGTRSDVETQVRDDQFPFTRAEYYLAALTMASLKEGERDFDQLPMRYVIVLSPKDPFCLGKGIYTFVFAETQTNLKPGKCCIIFANAENADTTTEIGRIIADLAQDDPSKMHEDMTANALYAIKYTQEDIEHMFREEDPSYQAGVMDGRQQSAEAVAKAQTAVAKAQTAVAKAQEEAIRARRDDDLKSFAMRLFAEGRIAPGEAMNIAALRGKELEDALKPYAV